MAANPAPHVPWCWLVESQLLMLLAVSFLVAAHRAHTTFFGWLLSSCVAFGLAIAPLYSFIASVGTFGLSAAGVVAYISIGLFVVRRATLPHTRR